jgi:hypothetical protein
MAGVLESTCFSRDRICFVVIISRDLNLLLPLKGNFSHKILSPKMVIDVEVAIVP